jgi:hypothetical protein
MVGRTRLRTTLYLDCLTFCIMCSVGINLCNLTNAPSQDSYLLCVSLYMPNCGSQFHGNAAFNFRGEEISWSLISNTEYWK